MKERINENMLIRYIIDEITEEERKQVHLWINDSELNTREFEHFKFILESGRKLAVESPADENLEWENFKLKRKHLQRKTHIYSINRKIKWLQVAAAAVFIIGVAAAGWFYSRKTDVKTPMITFATQKNVRTDTLPDGSIAILNRYSSITYSRQFQKDRAISLRGEAFFKVKHDEVSPFVVRTKKVMIQDIGTSFNVRSKAEQVEVVVESGTVTVHQYNISARVNAHEKIKVEPIDKQLHVEKNNDLLYNYYRSNEFVLNNTPLWRVVETLNDAYGVHISIKDNELRNIPLTVTLKRESLDNILQIIISAIPEIRMENKPDNIVLWK